jgi:hypothetical protein
MGWRVGQYIYYRYAIHEISWPLSEVLYLVAVELIFQIHIVFPNIHFNIIIAYRPDAKQWLCKQRPLLRNALNMQATIERRGFVTRF